MVYQRLCNLETHVGIVPSGTLQDLSKGGIKTALAYEIERKTSTAPKKHRAVLDLPDVDSDGDFD